MTDLHAYLPEGVYSQSFATGVSTSLGYTYISGWASDPSTGRDTPIVWTDEPDVKSQWSVRRIGGSFNSSLALGVSGGQQVGSVDVGPWFEAVMWSGTPASAINLTPPDQPGTEGTWGSAAYGVDGGRQVGSVGLVLRPEGSPSAVRHASMWSGSASSWTNLHPPGGNYFDSEAFAIRGSQQVGRAWAWSTASWRAMLWTDTAASFVDLHPPGLETWSEARGTSGTQQVGHVGFKAALWSGSAASYVNLHRPEWDAPYVGSIALATNGTQQVGWRGGINDDGDGPPPEAILWSGTAASAVSLQPPGTYESYALAMDATRQVGLVNFGAALWSGTAESWVNLHTLLPGTYSGSEATGISMHEGVITISGRAFTSGGSVAMLWTNRPTPLEPTWRLKNPATRPSARLNHAMAYDSARGVVVMFGGSGGTPREYNAETWEWNGTNWTQRAIGGPSPTRRDGHKMAYDAARGVTVLFGGETGSYANASYNGETWEWNGTSWTQRMINGPSPRHDCEMVYDERRQVVVLVGGALANQTISNETWELGSAGWVLRTFPPSLQPPTRFDFAMTYDADRGVTVLFGGRTSASPEVFNDLWEYNGQTWSNRGWPGQPGSPQVRYLHALAFNRQTRKVELFAGVTGYALGANGPSQISSDRWTWDGSEWTQVAQPSGSPAGRFYHSMVYDTARSEVVLFGGAADIGAYLNDTWTLKSPCVASSVAPRVQDALAYGTAVISLLAPPGGSATYQWRRNGVNLNGTANPTALSATVTLADLRPADAGTYDCIVTASCGSDVSLAATLTVRPRCTLSDVAGPGQAVGPDGQLTADDIIVYLNWFFAGDTRADVAGPGQSTTPDAQFTADDIIVFLNRFFAGCSGMGLGVGCLVLGSRAVGVCC